MLGFFLVNYKLDNLYFVGLQVFLVVDDYEGNFLVFLQVFEVGVLDGMEVNEQVVIVFWGDEVEVFGVVELFYGVVLMI